VTKPVGRKTTFFISENGDSHGCNEYAKDFTY